MKKTYLLTLLGVASLASADVVTISPNMGMPVPVVGQSPGPSWANDINASLSIIDSHDHTAGHGVPVPSSGLNINSDLPFGSNNATGLRSSRFTSQAVPISGGADLGAVYVAGADLYYNDENGNQVRITQGGSVAGSSGTITGLPSGTASASFSGGTFTFQSATNTPATMAIGPAKIGAQVANAKTVTIAPSNSLASSYSLTLPMGLPGATSFLNSDASGNMGFVGTTGSGSVCLATSPTISNPIFTGVLLAAANSAAAPAYSFSADPDMGMFDGGAGHLDFAVGGTRVADFTPGNISFSNPIRAPDGLVATPSFTFTAEPTTGFSRGGSGIISASSLGTDVMDLSSSSIASHVRLLGVGGNVSSPAYAFNSDGDTGIYNISLGHLGVAALGLEVLDIGASSVTINAPVFISGSGGTVPHSCAIVTATGSGTGTATVSCPATKFVFGGGCADTISGFRESYPPTTASWKCTSTNGGDTVTAYANCCVDH